MINNTSITGRLTRDPEIRYSQNGTAICNFTVAVNRTFRSNDGVDADFINVVAFRKSAENLANYQSKGSLIGITGRIQTRNYENQQGQRVFVTEVVAEQISFLESKSNRNEGSSNQQENNPYEGHGEPTDIKDDDLPF